MAEPGDNLPIETLVELGKLSMRMATDPKTRAGFLKGVKQVKPDYMIPGDQQVADLRQEIADKAEADRIEAAKNAALARQEVQRKGLLDGTLLPGRKFDEAQLKEIEEQIMPKYGIGDYEAAAKIYASDLKPPKPTPGAGVTNHGASWEFPDLPGLLEDPAKAAREAAHQVIKELRGA